MSFEENNKRKGMKRFAVFCTKLFQSLPAWEIVMYNRLTGFTDHLSLLPDSSEK